MGLRDIWKELLMMKSLVTGVGEWWRVCRQGCIVHSQISYLVFNFSKVGCFKIVCVCWLRMVLRKIRKRKLGSDWSCGRRTHHYSPIEWSKKIFNFPNQLFD